jgi:hypothetical protein
MVKVLCQFITVTIYASNEKSSGRTTTPIQVSSSTEKDAFEARYSVLAVVTMADGYEAPLRQNSHSAEEEQKD